MLRLICILTVIFSVALDFSLLAQQIVIDEQFQDWSDAPTNISDLNDNLSGIDIENLAISNDENYLFIQFTLDDEIQLQENNFLSLYIDSDQNKNTGFQTEGIGAEISFYFGDRSGFVNFSPGFENIIHQDIGLLTAPTVSSEHFEIAIRRQNTIDGKAVNLNGTIDIVFENDIYDGDKIPNTDSGVAYTFDENITSELSDYSFNRLPDTDLRILNYNVLRDDLFEPNLRAPYERILKAIDADIIAFQEIYENGSSQTAALIEQMIPSTGGQQWYHEKVGSDLVLLSRYPIIDDRWVDGNAAFVIDVDGKQVMVVNVHFPCCDNNAERQNEINALLQFIRETQNGFEFPLTQDAPIIIVGDYNLVGFRSQIESLLSGNITNNSSYGPDFSPDWGNGPLTDLNPQLTGLPATYTWQGENSSFFPGRLDYIVYTSSSIFPVNSYVLNTASLPQDDLSLNNLSQSDTQRNSDHLPMISDWSFEEIVSSSDYTSQPILNIWPNPFSGFINIATEEEIVYIQLYDLSGKLILTSQENTIKNLQLGTNIYIVKVLFADGRSSVQKVVSK